MDLQVFSNNGWEIRTIEKDGNPWFVGNDVARCLGYSDPKKAVSRHCKKANNFNGDVSSPRVLPVKVIPESDVYRLIMRSQLESAERFQDWVVEEVLPSIRKTGGYKIPATYSEALQLSANLQQKIEEDRPKVEFHDAVAVADDCVDMGGMAKLTKRDFSASTPIPSRRANGALNRACSPV